MPSSFLSSWFSRKNDTEKATSTPPSTSQSHHPRIIPPHRPASTVAPYPGPGATGAIRAAVDPSHVLTFTLGATSGAVALLAWRRWGMRLRSAEWITPNEFARRRWIRGVVTSVGDADGFRLYHTPGIGWRWPLKIRRVPTKRKDLTGQAINIRIAGVDAPECAHYGRPGQPHAEESLAWLKKRILGKTLYCQLVLKDQYGRIVGIPLVPRPFLPLCLAKYSGSSLAIEMLREGVATTYQESGAEYGPWGREKFMRIETEAREARRGIWRNGVDIETPGEFKKRYSAAFGTPTSKEDESESSGGEEEKDSTRKSSWSWRLVGPDKMKK